MQLLFFVKLIENLFRYTIDMTIRFKNLLAFFREFYYIKRKFYSKILEKFTKQT